MLHTSKIEYVAGDTVLEAYCAMAGSSTHKKPAVLIAHDWSGRSEFACQKAEQLAELGYVGFALDMYGHARVGKTVEEKSALIQPLMQDRALLRQRVLAAYEAVKRFDAVDHGRIAIIGYCFGGLCALDLARSGAAIRGAISFHGLLSAPTLPTHKISAKVMALHGHDDPMVTPQDVATFQDEMTKAGVDWQVHIYGHTKHAFTNPQAHDEKLGTVYQSIADRRSWITAKAFLTEVLM